MNQGLWQGLFVVFFMIATPSAFAEGLSLQLRSQLPSDGKAGEFERVTRQATWNAETTAIIVCDVWDYHHCLNAVRRLEEFAPRLNQVLQEGRKRGALVVHAPSDCMPAYAEHPARRRAEKTPRPAVLPAEIELWRSRIPNELGAEYPLDQSDGGEDDDPREHAEWAAKLKSLGRNPAMPWKAQSPLIEIDAERDFISDRGDEVWSILQERKIEHVILVGVHVNMCVLGRPFGLRQMVANGIDVVLMRGMTDAMYNPQRWPYVDHFTGTDLIVSYIERHVCPTITSDQLLGGAPFRSKFDTRQLVDVTSIELTRPREWGPVEIPIGSNATSAGEFGDTKVPSWYRCAVRLPREWADEQSMLLELESEAPDCQVWFNGQLLPATETTHGRGLQLALPSDLVHSREANLLVVRVASAVKVHPMTNAIELVAGRHCFALSGKWQVRHGEDQQWNNMPLPAMFGLSPDMLIEVSLQE